jgi:hypothetical protein
VGDFSQQNMGDCSSQQTMGFASQKVGDSSQMMGERFFKVLACAIPGLRFVFVDWEIFLWFWGKE